ncbi:sensor histidine kinase [Streptomyces daliensis]|uniref:histidine kinase n=1 Tax=Streptomyces daliensis TaxID=299421 RepID=A0A8T4INX1_9ACTN|nr:two-component sensor histidine kinase [Streptomyces daliensis]
MISPRRVPELWRRLEATVPRLSHGYLSAGYLALGLLLFAGSLVPALHSHGTQLGGLPARPFDALAIVAVALQCLPLAVCRRWPLVCLTLVSAGFVLDQLRGYHTFAGTGLAVALVGAGSWLERYRRATVLVLSAAYVPLSVAFHLLGGGEVLSEIVTFYLVLALPWGIGAWMRANRAAEAERRRRVAEDTLVAERTRIASELHDVVTHHVTAMVVQAEAARYLTAAPGRLDQALTAVTDTGRRAITDLRHLLDLLDPGHGTPAGAGAGAGVGGATVPPVGRLLTLVEQTRRAGQPVEFTEEGTPAESTGSADLVAYRLVQEALTNALKHAHGSRTSVRVRHGAKEISVEVGTEAPGTGAHRTRDADGPGSVGPRARAGFLAGSGRGLAGVRERVDVLGGEFSAGPTDDGGWLVRAHIPSGSPS